MIPSSRNANNYFAVSNINSDIERKNQLAALFLGSMNASLDSSRNNNNQQNQEQAHIHQQLYQSYQNLYLKTSENYDDQRMSFGNVNQYNNSANTDPLNTNILINLNSRNNQDS